MPDIRLKNPAVRILVAHPLAFANWQTPTAAELNARTGLVHEITCAVNQDGSTFDLGDSDTDDSLTFCQVAGAVNPTTANADIVLEIETSAVKNTANTANIAQGLLRYPGVEYFFIMSVGSPVGATTTGPGVQFVAGDQIKMARGETDFGVDVFGTGENIRLSQTPLQRGDINWNYKLAA